ncbi:MAG: hypothetical protein LAT83_23570 [Kiritimatiellae bacterium]|nr:hypothetical protein [Kiritimatiellia bacterium]
MKKANIELPTLNVERSETGAPIAASAGAQGAFVSSFVCNIATVTRGILMLGIMMLVAWLLRNEKEWLWSQKMGKSLRGRPDS